MLIEAEGYGPKWIVMREDEMPYRVEKRGSKWAIVKSDTGKVVGRSVSKAKALASMRIRYAKSRDY